MFQHMLGLEDSSFLGFLCLIFILAMSLPGGPAIAEPELTWKEIVPGYWQTEMSVAEDSFNIPATILIFKFDPSLIEIRSFWAKTAIADTAIATDVVKSTKSLLAINANFFDKKGKALGLVIRDKQVKQHIHKKGRVMGGIFYRKANQLAITHRETFSEQGVNEAVQCGPRLIDGGRPLKLISSHTLSRRSGIAVTRQGMGIIYITLSRFPGASLHSIQRMLLDPRLDILDALNLDGGGSSQIYVPIVGSLLEEIWTSGGDPVPVFLTLNLKSELGAIEKKPVSGDTGKTNE